MVAALFRALLISLCYSPLPLAWRLGRAYAGALDLVLPRLRRYGMRNLELAGYPEAEWERIIDGVFASIGRTLVAFARFPRINAANISSWIRCEGAEHYAAAKRAGKGVLFATAHFGGWELSAFAHALITEPMNVVVRPLDNPLADEIVETRRAMSGNMLITKKDGARSILRALKENQAVGILIDQNTFLAEGVFIDFFGVKACAGKAFAKIAQHSGAAVLPGFAIWLEVEQRWVLRFYPPVTMTGDLLADTQRIHTQLEQVIREYPDQWLWIHRRWKTRPAGEASIY